MIFRKDANDKRLPNESFYNLMIVTFLSDKILNYIL